MGVWKLLIRVFLFLLADHSACFVSIAACPEIASSVGQHFMFGLPSKMVSGASNNYIYVQIVAVSKSTANVRIISPFNNYDRLIAVSNTIEIQLSDGLTQLESGRQFKGIEVFSDTNISLSVIAYYGYYNTESFLVLPVTALSTNYIAASYHPSANSKSSVLVVGVESNTDVSIKYKTAGQSSFSFQNVTLQKFETFQLIYSHDLSGTEVTSNKPVAVMSGSSNSRIPVGIGEENYLVEQMIPTKYWTTKFIVPPIPNNNYIVKILVVENNTEIHFYNSTNHFGVYLDHGSVYDFMFGSDPTVILANRPISVFQYLAHNTTTDGIPYMTTVQGLSQFVSSYKFYTNGLYSTDRTIVLQASRDILNLLQINGKNISSWNMTIVPVAKPMNDYTTLFINVSAFGTHTLQHINGETFGASMYLLYENKAAYGHLLNLSLQAECETGGPTPTGIPNGDATTNHMLTSLPNGNGTWCMECDNMSHLKYCDSVTRCGTDHEMCYVQAYERSVGKTAYRSGCMDSSKCQNYEGSMHCQHCCDGNFCNTAGCGDPGLPDKHSRGPLCFDCAHTGDDELCQTLQMCQLGQVCKVEKYKWGNGFHYSMGCVEKTACSSKRNLHNLASRNMISCSRCCDSDFCNANCTIENTPAIIG